MKSNLVVPVCAVWLSALTFALAYTDVDNESPRSRRAAGDDPPGLIREPCLQWYVEEIHASLWHDDEKKEDHAVFTQQTVKPTKNIVDCSKAPKLINMSLEFSNERNQHLDLDLVFSLKKGSHWELLDGESRKTQPTSQVVVHNFANDGKSVPFSLRPTEISASDEHSFSCVDLELRSTKPKDQKYTLILKLKRLQVQPFKLPDNKKKVFADSYDCSTWFTIPLWIGFLVILFFTTILAFGVYALMDIKTPDRFENPKGKTITITATE